MRCWLARLILTAALTLPASVSWAKPVLLRFTVWDGDPGLQVIRGAVQEFEQANPDIKVKLENIPYGAYSQKMLAQFAANAAPDAAMFEPKMFQRFAKRGVLLPLDPLIAQTQKFDLNAYYKPIVEALRYQGNLYVLPRDVAPIGLIYYNKRLFREAGIPYPDGTWTWDWEPRPELREKCFTWVMQQLSKRGSNGKPIQWGFVPGWVRAWADTVVYSTGARYLDNPEQPKQWLWDTPEVIRSYQWVADLALRRHWMPSSTDIRDVMQSSSSQLFLRQKVAMFQSGIWEVPSFRKVLQPGTPEFFDWDITLAPGHLGKDGKITRAAPTGGSGYGILRSTKHPKEAWRLLQWMGGAPAMRAMAKAGLAQPAIRSLALEEPWVPGPNTPEEQRYPKNRIVTDQAVPFVVVDPTADYVPEVQTFVDAKIDSIMDGSATAEAALKQGNREAMTRLAQIMRQESRSPFPWATAAALGIALFLALVLWVFKGARSKADRRDNLAGLGFISPWLVGLLLFTLGPMILSLLMSTSDWDIIGSAKWVGSDNFSKRWA
ncbi:MAG TPA: extracellular solute-binding protein, partial [Fimbriimonadaceae bacterium]|nr:extracellular solute-binding protein [Fimbriimonadaceae bacterium]